MPGAARRRNLVSFLRYFGPPAMVWLAGSYCLYRATELDGVVSQRSFALGLLLVICGTFIAFSTRSRQTRTREQALESSLQLTNKRIRKLEQTVEDLILDAHTDNAVRAILETTDGGRFPSEPGRRYMRLVSNENGSNGSEG